MIHYSRNFKIRKNRENCMQSLMKFTFGQKLVFFFKKMRKKINKIKKNKKNNKQRKKKRKKEINE